MIPFRTLHRVRSSLWLVPAPCVVAGVPLSRRPALERRRRMPDDADGVPLVADLQGIGSGRDVSARAAT